ncbi:MAG TPA: dihydroorotate dehydrogenase [Candidatus Omnitrophota bacterium]|jgi:dihydroorotate dehydrogenase (NAD+) catalytic subunit|nr:dihydroorotate dehydrogenase [Candidatus Omnitrophota bacterium]HSA30652.1 dihydroorotate dehydrogenase [Candidatus Omnitrophota bacterium]
MSKNLKVKIANVEFQNPLTVASGTFWYKPEYYSDEEMRRFGAIVPKTVTLRAQEGNPPPRVAETPSGMLNAIGIENGGVDDFIANKLPGLLRTGVPVIPSILGHDEKEFVELAQRFNGIPGVAALEVNLSCPNLRKKVLIAQDPELTRQTVHRIKKATKLPVIAKLTPNVTDIKVIARGAQDGGADGLSLINTLSAMAIDVKKRRPVLGNVTGGLSGPAIKPVAVRMVYEAFSTVGIPIIAMGGIVNAHDALEFIMAGATMVAVGTMNFVDPLAPFQVLEGIEQYMKDNGIKDIKELIGCAV